MKTPQPHRIKHLPTGLFYRPSTEVLIKGKALDNTPRHLYVKTNLSKRGKVYNQFPSLKHIGGGIYNHLITQRLFIDFLEDKKLTPYDQFRWKNIVHAVPTSDWLVEKFEDNKWVSA